MGEIRILFFGITAEIHGNAEEIINHKSWDINLSGKENIIQLFPSLESTTFAVAINQELNYLPKAIEEIKEIAILPPFAGG